MSNPMPATPPPVGLTVARLEQITAEIDSRLNIVPVDMARELLVEVRRLQQREAVLVEALETIRNGRTGGVVEAMRARSLAAVALEFDGSALLAGGVEGQGKES